MLTVKIDVNGEPVADIEIQQVKVLDKDERFYRYDIFHADGNKDNGNVHHFRSDGALKLVERVINDYHKFRGKKQNENP